MHDHGENLPQRRQSSHKITSCFALTTLRNLSATTMENRLVRLVLSHTRVPFPLPDPQPDIAKVPRIPYHAAKPQ